MDLILSEHSPLTPLIRVEYEDEVMEAADDRDCGLGAYLYSRDLQRAWRMARQ